MAAVYHNTQTALVVADVLIPEDADGRFNLNVLHRASEHAERSAKAPNRWLELKGTQALIAELATQTQDLESALVVLVNGGTGQGTYAHQLLAIEYAGWISPAFRLKVNQAFLDKQTGKPSPELLPLRAEEQTLALIDHSVTLLERLGSLDSRDRLFYADQVRNISRRALLPPTTGTAVSVPATPPLEGASVSDRLYVLAPQLSQKAHRTLSIEGGKRCAAEYRSRNQGNNPQEFMQFVDGAKRPVRWYAPENWEWVDAILQTLVAQQGAQR